MVRLALRFLLIMLSLVARSLPVVALSRNLIVQLRNLLHAQLQIMQLLLKIINLLLQVINQIVFLLQSLFCILKELMGFSQVLHQLLSPFYFYAVWLGDLCLLLHLRFHLFPQIFYLLLHFKGGFPWGLVVLFQLGDFFTQHQLQLVASTLNWASWTQLVPLRRPFVKSHVFGSSLGSDSATVSWCMSNWSVNLILLRHVLMQSLAHRACRGDRLGCLTRTNQATALNFALWLQVIKTLAVLRQELTRLDLILTRVAKQMKHLETLVFLKVVAWLETSDQVPYFRKPPYWHAHLIRKHWLLARASDKAELWSCLILAHLGCPHVLHKFCKSFVLRAIVCCFLLYSQMFSRRRLRFSLQCFYILYSQRFGFLQLIDYYLLLMGDFLQLHNSGLSLLKRVGHKRQLSSYVFR